VIGAVAVLLAYHAMKRLAERKLGALRRAPFRVLVMLYFAQGPLASLRAIGWHAFVDGTVVYAAGRFGLPTTEAAVALFGVASLAIIRWARRALDAGLPVGSFVGSALPAPG
jgi:hypothetical protein